MISIANTNGLSFHCDGTLEIENQSFFRKFRGPTKKLMGVETTWSDDIINLVGLTNYMDTFSRRCLLGENDASQLTTAIKAAIKGLGTLNERYVNQEPKKKIVTDLQTTLQQCLISIKANTTLVISNNYWESLHEHLLKPELAAKETAIIASSYLAVGREVVIRALEKKRPHLSLCITVAEKLQLPRIEQALLITRIMHRLKTQTDAMQTVVESLKKIALYHSSAQSQIQALFEKNLLLLPPKPKSTGLITDWIKPLLPEK